MNGTDGRTKVMGVYIKSMEMPKDEYSYTEIQIWGDGTVYKREGAKLIRCKSASAVEVSDHGDLIDKSVLYDHIKDGYDIDLQENPILLNAILEMVDYQEVVIPADKEEV